MRRFNFAAAFWGRLWMAYHFLFTQLLLTSILQIIVYTAIESVFRFYYDDMIRGKIYANMVSLIYMCLKFVLFGFLGKHSFENRKEKRLYKITEYFEKHEKSIVFSMTVVLIYIIWIATAEQMLIMKLTSDILY